MRKRILAPVRLIMSVKSFKLKGAGLGSVLGSLEAEIMEALWELGEASIQDVCDGLGSRHKYKTVMTVMNRLVQKRVLARRKDSKAFVYTPLQRRDEFIQSVSKSIIGSLIGDFGQAAIAQFVDAVDELGPEELAKLHHLIKEKTQDGQPRYIPTQATYRGQRSD